MSELLQQLGGLSAAEEFFALLGVDYDQTVIDVNRLHILKRFNQYLKASASLTSLDDAALRDTCRELLARAYQDFVRSTPQQEKVFKVFQDAAGQRQVSLDSLRQSLPTRR
jgi:nitrogenase-stabilizing/protective protein